MITLTEQDLDEFVALWEQEFGITPDRSEVRHRVTQLLELMMVVLRPLPEETAAPTSSDQTL